MIKVCLHGSQYVLTYKVYCTLDSTRRKKNKAKNSRQDAGEYIFSLFVVVNPDMYFRISNDIAILKLSRDVELNDYVVPACLPSSSSTSYTGQQAAVSGEHVNCLLRPKVCTEFWLGVEELQIGGIEKLWKLFY